MNWIKEWIITNQGVSVNLVYSIGLFVGLIILKRSTIRVLTCIKGEACQKYNTKKLVTSIYIVVYLFGLLLIWQDSSSFMAFLGLFTGGLAIAMKEFIMNMAGGLYVLWAKPFVIGDRIQIGEQSGDVIDVSLLQFSILEVGKRIQGEQSTGRIINIPNMQVFSLPLANYEKGFKYIWNELVIPLSGESDWELAKSLIYPIAISQSEEIIEKAKVEIEQAGKKYMIYYANLTPIIYTQVKDNKINLVLRYLCEPRQARVSEHILWEEILKIISHQENIHLGI
ncbi:MAG: mechanosensitive ion channel family protein [Cellulosilyticaceae bacterium]